MIMNKYIIIKTLLRSLILGVNGKIKRLKIVVNRKLIDTQYKQM